MEKGDPSVSMGVYATALWLMDRASALGELAAPEHDQGALENAVRATRTRAVNRRPSVKKMIDRLRPDAAEGEGS
jgi:hypothetical protein